MKVLISEDHHFCLRCPYSPKCEMVCSDLERMDKFVESMKEEFGIGFSLLHITPLRIERLRAKYTEIFTG